MSKLPGLGWLGPKDADAVAAADAQPSTELPPPSSAAIPNLPVKQAAASQASGQPNVTASAAVNTEPLKTYPSTPYPNFQVAQTKPPAPQNYTTGTFGTVATPVPSQNVQTLETTTNQPQPQQGFYPNYDSSTRRSQQQPAETYTPGYTLPLQTDASTSFNHVAPQNQPTYNPPVDQLAASPNMPAAYLTPQQGNVPQHQHAAPIPSTAVAELNVPPATYATAAQTTAASRADAVSTSPSSYYGNAQQQLGGHWRPGSTSCQDGACLASSSSEANCQNGICTPPQATVPQVAQPYQRQANSDAVATQPEGSSNRVSLWR